MSDPGRDSGREKRRLRICAWHDLPSGGGRRAFEDHVSGLVDLGHEIIVFCPRRREQAPALPASVRVIQVPLHELPGLHVDANLPPTRSVLADTLAHERHFGRVADLMNSYDPDVIWANTSRRVRCPDLGARAAAPAVLYLQEPYRWFYEALPVNPWIGLPLRRPSHFLRSAAWRGQAQRETAASGRYDRILVNSYFSRESVVRAYGVESSVCYLGIDPVRFSPFPGPRRNAVISVGAMMPEKRFLEIVVAVGRVPAAQRPSLDIVSNVTDGGYALKVREAASVHGVSLTLHPAITDAELVALLGSALALVYAPRLEPFGLAPLEASAVGTPVVGVAEGGVRETVVDGVNGLLVDDVEALADGIATLASDPGFARRLGEAGRQLVLAKWTSARAAERLEAHLLDAAR